MCLVYDLFNGLSVGKRCCEKRFSESRHNFFGFVIGLEKAKRHGGIVVPVPYLFSMIGFGVFRLSGNRVYCAPTAALFRHQFFLLFLGKLFKRDKFFHELLLSDLKQNHALFLMAVAGKNRGNMVIIIQQDFCFVKSFLGSKLMTGNGFSAIMEIRRGKGRENGEKKDFIGKRV
jgi:hypothetical protein